MKDIPKTTNPALNKLVGDMWSEAPAYGWHIKFSIMENIRHNEQLRNKRRVDRLQDKAEGSPAHRGRAARAG